MKARTNVCVTVLAVALAAVAAHAAPLKVPFDYSKNEIAIDVSVDGAPLYMLLDTGLDPSAIDQGLTQKLHLKIDRKNGGEASGEGDAKHVVAYPTTIDRLSIGGKAFGSVDALTIDTSILSAHYGRRLDGVLGFSFLKDKIVLIDYSARMIGLLDRAADAAPAVKSCRTIWTTPLTSYKDDAIPIIAAFRFGNALAPISLDTGSSGSITLYNDALALPGVRAALSEKGVSHSAGARGESTSKTYALSLPVGFGPFSLPPGQIVVVRENKGHDDPRAANIGNRLLAAMKLKMLLDYRARQMTFYGGCD
jgi:hypothetical protein